MKTLILVAVYGLFLLLALAPALTVSAASEPQAQADTALAAQCQAGGGCFLVTEDGFRQAMVMAFGKGFQTGKEKSDKE